MCHGQKEHQINFRHLKHASVCDCGCGHTFRCYFSAKEKQELLEEYKGQLEKELAAVNEHLGEIKGK